MISPLKDHENTTSMEGSLDTTQGRTILSPTVTSIAEGGVVMTVLSVKRGKMLFFRRQIVSKDNLFFF